VEMRRNQKSYFAEKDKATKQSYLIASLQSEKQVDEQLLKIKREMPDESINHIISE